VAVVEAGEGKVRDEDKALERAPALEPQQDQVGVAPPRACRALS
jgi:hypothetical protein